LAFGGSAAAVAQVSEPPANTDRDKEIARYTAQAEKSPNKPGVWRKLGVAYFNADSLDRAQEALTKANALDPNDASSIVWLGMIHEKKGEMDQARGLYQSFLSLHKGDRLTQEIRYRLRWFEDQQLQEMAKTAVANEKKVKVSDIPKNSIAVIRFAADSLQPRFRPLGRGLAELIYTDLSYVPELKLVERMELPRIQKELDLSLSEFTDKLYAPRVGKIVGAAKIVTGQLSEGEEGGINIDCGIIDVGPGLAEYPGVQKGKLAEFFAMQKRLVLSIIDKLGYQITPAIKGQIDKSPTESFLAMIAYSRGLDYADQGLYPLAEAEFKEALAQDPQFEAAQHSLDQFGGLSNYDGNLKPIAGITDLANKEPTTKERRIGSTGDIIHRLLDTTRGPVSAGDTPFIAPQTSGGRVVITGRTEPEP
jgi:tetratricopeptide (TPR) repeat protein